MWSPAAARRRAQRRAARYAAADAAAREGGGGGVPRVGAFVGAPRYTAGGRAALPQAAVDVAYAAPAYTPSARAASRRALLGALRSHIDTVLPPPLGAPQLDQLVPGARGTRTARAAAAAASPAGVFGRRADVRLAGLAQQVARAVSPVLGGGASPRGGAPWRRQAPWRPSGAGTSVGSAPLLLS